MKDLSASIVAYKNTVEILEKTIQSFLGSTWDSNLYVVDNSSTDQLKALVNDPRIIARFNNKNIGFRAVRGSSRNFLLTWCNIQSAIRYFDKWGWLSDSKREFFNQRTIQQLVEIK